MDVGSLLAGTKEVVDALVRLLLSGVSVLLGVLMIFSGIRKMLAHGRGERQGQGTMGPVAINLLMGSFLLQLSTMVDSLIYTMFGTEREEPNAAMSYMPAQVADNEMLRNLVNVAVLWVFAIGFVAVIRGFVLWNEMANGQGRGQDNGWKGFWHIFFGAMAINLTGVLRLFGS